MLVLIFDTFSTFLFTFSRFCDVEKLWEFMEKKGMAFFQVLCPWDFQQIAFENCDLEKKQTWKHGIFFLVGMFFTVP